MIIEYIFYEYVQFWLQLFGKIIAYEMATEVAGAQSNWKLIMLTRNFVSSIRKQSEIKEKCNRQNYLPKRTLLCKHSKTCK